MLTVNQPVIRESDEGKITIQIGSFFYDVPPEEYQKIKAKQRAIAPSPKGGDR